MRLDTCEIHWKKHLLQVKGRKQDYRKTLHLGRSGICERKERRERWSRKNFCNSKKCWPD